MTEQGTFAAPGELVAYKLAYDEAVRAIEGQREAVDEIRTRSGVLLSATAIVTGFLGPPALQGGPTLVAWVAAGLLVASVAMAVYVLLPTDGWRFAVGTKLLLSGYIETEPTASMQELYRSLAWYLESNWESNKTMLAKRYDWFTFAAVLLVSETMVWLAVIASR
jgi:hypothetical protein